MSASEEPACSVGCIPTKAMLFSAELFDHLKHAEKYGIDGVSDPRLNWKNLLARKDEVIMRHTKGLDFLMKKNKITAIKGYGRLTGTASDGVHSVEVKSADGKTQIVKAKKVVLAMGSDARMLPGYTADDTIMTNIEILKTEILSLGRLWSSAREPSGSSSPRSSRASARM